MPMIGMLSSRTLDMNGPLVAAFRRGLAENGYAEGRNVVVEYLGAGGDYGRLPALAVELVRRPVNVLVSVGGEPTALAAKAATSTIPTVTIIGSDPVGLGLAGSDSRPGGNITGVNIATGLVETKRLGLLRELVPQATSIGVLLNPANAALAIGQERTSSRRRRPSSCRFMCCGPVPSARSTLHSTPSLSNGYLDCS
jgi:putative tryptophan/tyrosine transport system substrate-binding protein